MKFASIVAALIPIIRASSAIANPSLPPPRMDSISNTVSEQAAPIATTHGEVRTPGSSRPLPTPPPRTAEPRLPKSLTPSQLNAIRAHLKLIKDGKPTAKQTQQPSRALNEAISNANTHNIDNEAKVHSLNPNTVVNGILEQLLTEAASLQLVVKEEKVGVEVVEPWMIPQGPNTSG